MNKNTIFPASAPSRTKRVALGAASVLTAGALLGVGAQGATAAPLSPAGTSSSTSSAESSEGSTARSDAFLASIHKELRADVSNGKSAQVKAQKLATTITGHAELFASLPANLQTDLTTLADATAAERADAVQTIENTALAGGYGEEITRIAEAVQANPKHPLAAGIRAALGSDLGSTSGGDQEQGESQDAGPSMTKLALSLANAPGLFEKLPANLQSDLTTLKDAPAAEQDAAAAVIGMAAVDGEYGDEIQKIAVRVQAHHDGMQAGAEADAGTETDAGN